MLPGKGRKRERAEKHSKSIHSGAMHKCGLDELVIFFYFSCAVAGGVVAEQMINQDWGDISGWDALRGIGGGEY